MQLDSPYNDRTRWADAGIFKTPEFDFKSYQKRLDNIVGLSPSGHSIVRLRWAWDCRKWENTDWDSSGIATAGEWRQQYRVVTIDIGGGDYVDISPPRWILEERYEPEAIAQSWELTRYQKKVTGQPAFVCPSCYRMKWISMEKSEADMAVCRFCNYIQVLMSVNQDVWGPVPREGWYNMLPHIGIIADHSNNCCKKAWNDAREICYGIYKEPNGKELKRLKKGISLRNKDMATNPHIRPELDDVALNQAKTWGLQMMRDTEVKKRTELAEIQRSHRFNGNRIYA